MKERTLTCMGRRSDLYGAPSGKIIDDGSVEDGSFKRKARRKGKGKTIAG